MTTAETTQLTTCRDAIIAEHIDAECGHDIPRALDTFASPHYHVYALDVDAPGAEAVANLLGAIFTAFPDFEFVPLRTYHAENEVVVEGKMIGTHEDVWADLAGTGNRIDVPTCCIYHFEEDRLMSESVYFDHGTLLSQINSH